MSMNALGCAKAVTGEITQEAVWFEASAGLIYFNILKSQFLEKYGFSDKII